MAGEKPASLVWELEEQMLHSHSQLKDAAKREMKEFQDSELCPSAASALTLLENWRPCIENKK